MAGASIGYLAFIGRNTVFSFLKRKQPPAAVGALDEAESVQAARTRARRRLIGAAVLVVLGIVGFPLLFETQPRPIAVDVPIEIPARDAVPPLTLPPPKGAAVTASAPPAGEATERAAVEPSPSVASAPIEAAAPPVKAAPEKALDERSRERDALRAQALLDGKPVPPVESPATVTAPKAERFVVQAGAYADAASLREARQKVEKLGLTTYIQVVNTDAGPRTRVRVGPFDTRDEADKVAARIKGSGLAANVLRL